MNILCHAGENESFEQSTISQMIGFVTDFLKFHIQLPFDEKIRT
jgi:hypothetical protein